MNAQTTLAAGDIAFVGFNADGNDDLSFVALVDIAANTTITFEDNEWNGTTWVDANENAFIWTANASVTAGSVVNLTAVSSATPTASTGSVAYAPTVPHGAGRGVGNNDEIVYAYQGTRAAPTFITAVTNGTGGFTGANGLITGTGLTGGVNAVDLNARDEDGDIYSWIGTRSGYASWAAVRSAINATPISANWNFEDASGDQSVGGTAPDVPFSLTGFSLATPLPLVSLSVSASAGAEAATTVITVTATANAAVAADETVSLAVTGAGITAGDFTLSNATITIPNGMTTGTVTFTIANDAVVDGLETATLTISSPSAGVALGATISQNVAITDNDSNIDLSKYVRVGRYDLPEPTRTTPPANNLLAQEASGVTFNWDTNTLFIVGDGGTSVTEVTKAGVFVSSMTLTGSGSEFLDTEGITYIGGGQFVLTEERVRQAVKFTYVAGGTLTRAAAQTVKLGTTIGNIGIEGLSYDPQTSGFIIAKEAEPLGLFQTTIDFTAGTASNGSSVTVNSTNLFTPELASLEDMSDVFALSNLPSLSGQPDAGNLLILSQESGLVRNLDRSGNIYSTLTLVADAGNPLTIQNQTHEGITMDQDGNIYIVSENGGGNGDFPQLWVFAPSMATNVAPTALTLSTASTTIPENQPTLTRTKVATLVVTDADGIGVNQLSVGGADAASFEIIGSGLYLKAGEVLSFTTKPTYDVSVNVDDTSVGVTPDAFANFTLNITEVIGGNSPIRVTEVAPWSSGNSALAADWFELTNTSATAVDITGWKMYDSGAGGFGSSGPLSGITTIAPGESVIFVDGSAKVGPFGSHWFGANLPVGIQIGSYAGPGLSTGGDAVNIYNAAGVLQSNISFGASTPTPGPFLTFDNTAALNNATVTQLSALGSNGAFTSSVTTNEIGSPGTATVSSVVLVSITATDASAAEAATDPGTFRISRTGSTTLALDVIYTIAAGAGEATSADYTPVLTSPATIPAGQSFVDVTITPVDDALGEASETVTLTLGDTGSYDVGSPAAATVTILDNDLPNAAPTAVSLNNAVATITEITPTTSAIKVADIVITDDLQGTNTLAVSGTDAAFFEITGNALFLKAGTALSFTTKPSFSVTVEVDDTSLGATPDASVSYNLAVLASPAPGTIIVSEIVPWASGNSPIAVDWYEVTNTGAVAVNISGWRWIDSNNTLAASQALNGITSIAPGESVIFLQTTDLAGKSAAFKTLWFGSASITGLQIGSYSGPGLGTGGDAVNLFDTSGNKITGVSVGASPAAPYTTFDNAQGLSGAVTLASAVGINGAFVAANSPNEIGSPGTIVTPSITITATDATATEDGTNTGTFRVSRNGPVFAPLTANFTAAAGAGQATSADFTPSIGTSVVIPSASAFVDLTITPVLDFLVEGNETVTLTLADTSSYDVGSPDAATVTIADSRFATWLAANGYTSTGLDADTDGDGIKDGVEFFFNANPNNGAGFGNFPQIFPNGGALELDFTRLTDSTGVTGEFQVSSDLNTWTAALLGVDYTVLSSVPTGDETAFTYALPGTGPSAPGVSAAYTAPNTTAPFAKGASLGGVRVENKGLVGVGRLSGESLDVFGETQGAASGLFITNWAWNGSQFTGKFNVLPDRGYNTSTVFSNYAARLHEVDFTFVPYTGTAFAGQGQIVPTYNNVTTKFTYLDGATTKFTTGLNPTGTSTILGQTVGTVTAANGPNGSQTPLISFDAEAVHLFADGSGYVSDEYGTYIARFNSSKQITGITQLPTSARPHNATNGLDFTSVTPPAQVSGRRVNQGLEGMSVTPDGTRLFAVMQSALVQDTGTNASNRNNTRLFVYDVSGANRETPVLIGQYVVILPRIDSDGNASLDAVAAQSEIVALNDTSFLMLPRDGNGLGRGTTAAIVFKSVQLVDFASATNILGTYDAEGNSILVSGNLAPGVKAAASAEVINMLDPADLAKFGLNTNTAAPNGSTLNEKMEGMALVPDLSTPQGNDFFLFVANDNDFQSSNVQMLNAAGAFFGANGQVGGLTNDAMFYAYRISIDAGGKKFFRFGVK